MPASSTLETPRLLFRPPRPEDAAAIFARYASDPRVTRFMAWPTHHSLDDTRGFIAFAETQWAHWPAGSLQIFRRSDGRLLGGTGLDFETPTRAETGYVLAVDAWGRGYATEALGAMIGLARKLGVRELTAGCHPDHHASIRVLEKRGFTLMERQPRISGFPNLEPTLTQDRLTYRRTL